MKLVICPNCNNTGTLVLISDGLYRCNSCGYTGDISGKSVFKTIK